MNPCADIASRFRHDVAVRAQQQLASRVILEDYITEPEVVVGLDVSYLRLGELELGVGVASVLEWRSMKHRASYYIVKPVCVPYIPGLLAFREMEVLTPLVSRVLSESDLLVVDGHGISHPRYFGIASHIGVVFDKPSIGVAKHKLVGVEREEMKRKVVVHGGRIVAEVVDLDGVKLYVSPGHKISLDTAVAIIKKMIVRPRDLPEPTRIADIVSKKVKVEVLKRGRVDSSTLEKIHELRHVL